MEAESELFDWIAAATHVRRGSTSPTTGNPFFTRPLSLVRICAHALVLPRRQCGDPDDFVFVAELLLCFYAEALPRLVTLMEAALAHRAGAASFAAPRRAAKPIAEVVVEEAHAIKGSAANLLLTDLSEVRLPPARPPSPYARTSRRLAATRRAAGRQKH